VADPRPRARRWPAPRRKKDPGLRCAIAALLVDETAGDPVTGVLWTRRSVRSLAATLSRHRPAISAPTVGRLLRHWHYGLRANRKRLAAKEPADRDALFHAIVAIRQRFLHRGDPVLSVDAKHHVLIGPFATPGRAWTRQPVAVRMYDYRKDAEGVAIPYGIYDVGRDHGYVVVGTSRETSAFAGAALCNWWRHVGRRRYPRARRLLIACDSGGANDVRRWAWKAAVQHLADVTGYTITVTHYPAGASKWNLVEHRLFNRISATWTARPLRSYEHVLKSIRATRTASGQRCCARLDSRVYSLAGRIPREQLPDLQITRDMRFPQHIYVLRPRHRRPKKC
jgi:hypothetical protein